MERAQLIALMAAILEAGDRASHGFEGAGYFDTAAMGMGPSRYTERAGELLTYSEGLVEAQAMAMDIEKEERGAPR